MLAWMVLPPRDGTAVGQVLGVARLAVPVRLHARRQPPVKYLKSLSSRRLSRSDAIRVLAIKSQQEEVLLWVL